MADGAPVLLVLDYPGRRDVPAVATMDLEGGGFDVRYLLAVPPSRELTSESYAARLVADHGPFGPEVAAVLAYCMGATIGQDVARLVSDSVGAAVPLILLDAESPTPVTIAEQYAMATGQLLEQLGSSGAPPGNTFDASELRYSPSRSLDRMRRGLTELAATAIGGELGDAAESADVRDVAEQLSDVYVDWLAHLVAAYNATYPEWGGDILHLTSHDHHYQRDWPGGRRTVTVRMDRSREDLIGDSQVRAQVLSYAAQRHRLGHH
jgi:hypothetical protein